MLKFQISKNEFSGDTEQIQFSDIELENYGYTDGNSISVMFTCDEPHNLKVGDYLKIVSTVPYWNDIMNETQEEGDVAYLQVATSDEFSNTFGVIASKYKTLDCSNAYIKEENSQIYWYFDFTPTHHYRVGDSATLYLVYNNSEYVFISNAEVIDCETVKWSYDPTTPNIEACQQILFPDWTPAEGGNIDGLPQRIQFTRPQVKWDYYLSTMNGLDVYVNRYKVSVNIPIQTDGDVRLYSEENIREYFIENETENAINNPTDMEKRVYSPVIMYNNEIHDVFQINFNLHLRAHSGADWTVENEDDWNFSRYGTHEPKYYSYSNKDNQADLLSYLNFTTSDVKYQKNKLKKTFLRLTYYDSMNPGSQNLLAYSTVFFDTGKLYSKTLGNSLLEAYYYDDWTPARGIGVDREVNTTNLAEALNLTSTQITDEIIENHRLSTQFSVQNKFASNNSSEGFYLYLWADNDNGIMPEAIYMKVDLNHAGCGRTIPFMAPYNDINIEGYQGFKTNAKIIDDWTNGGYGIQQYLRYSYIKFLYKYDKANNRHIYYPDPERYNLRGENILNINLYEARVAF